MSDPAPDSPPVPADAPGPEPSAVETAAAEPPAPGEPPAPDFLPPAFHGARVATRVRAWRWTAGALAAALVLAGLLGGFWRTQRLRAARDAAVAEAAVLHALDARAAALRSELAAADRRAAVLAGLHLRTPPSRLLADLSAALPDGVTLTGVTLARLPPPRSADEADPPADPVAADAAALARRRRAERLELRIGGTAPTDAAVAGLLARAAAGGAFDAVELLFTDRAPAPRAADGEGAGANDGGAARVGRVFSARLTARPAAAAD